MNVFIFDPSLMDHEGRASTNLGDIIIRRSIDAAMAEILPAADIERASSHQALSQQLFQKAMLADLVLVAGTNLLSSHVLDYNQWELLPGRDFYAAPPALNAVLMGVGWWQYQDEPDAVTAGYYRKILSHSVPHSARDAYTAGKLKGMGVANVYNTSCPTLWKLDGAQTARKKKNKTCLFCLTDYNRKPEDDNGFIELLLETYDRLIFFPQGSRDAQYAASLPAFQRAGRRVSMLPHAIEALYKTVGQEKEMDYIGTRLHAGILCLEAGLQSLILGIDNRASEIAGDTNLPVAPRGDTEAVRRWLGGGDLGSGGVITLPVREITRWKEALASYAVKKSVSGAVYSFKTQRGGGQGMRVAVISTLAQGGAFNAAWRICHALADHGHECSFFVLEKGASPLQIPLMDGEPQFWTAGLFKYWSRLTPPEALAACGTELFSDTLMSLHVPPVLPDAILRAEVIHLHWVSGMIFSPALLQAMAGKKIVWTLHDENAFTGGCHYAGDCQKFKSRCGECHLLAGRGPDDKSAVSFYLKGQVYPFIAPYFVTPSAWLAERAKAGALLQNYPVRAVPNPLDIENYKPPQDRPGLRKELNLPEGAFVIMSGSESLGNPRKNAKMFFEALDALYGQAPDLPVFVVTYGHGQPPEGPFPARHFGYISGEPDMARLYAAADIFVHTALQENLSCSLCEAQACGTPTLCFAAGGCGETMEPGETGFLVTEITSRALAEKLREIIAGRGRLGAMREKARAFALERFNPRAAAAAYTEIFEKAPAAQGLEAGSPLAAALVQNQVASLAAIFQYDSIEKYNALQWQHDQHDALRGQHDALRGQHDALRGQHDALREGFENMRRNMRHPLRWFFRKLRGKLFKA